MNEFGTPMNELELSQQTKKIIPRQLLEERFDSHEIRLGEIFKKAVNVASGVVGVAAPWVGVGLNLVGGLLGGNKENEAARQQAAASNEYTDKKYFYDLEQYEAQSRKMIADRDHMLDEIAIKARNEKRSADATDAANAKRYNFDLKIRNQQQDLADRTFVRSNDAYDKTISYNSRSKNIAYRDQARQLEEIHDEAAFDANEAWIEMLNTEGRIRAKWSGAKADRSETKWRQGEAYAAYGREVKGINQSLEDAGRSDRSAFDQIDLDKSVADLRAETSRVLDPGELPMYEQAAPTLLSEYQLPRAWQDFDFGPAPIRGVAAVPQTKSVFAGALSTIGGMIGSSDKPFDPSTWTNRSH